MQNENPVDLLRGADRLDPEKIEAEVYEWLDQLDGWPSAPLEPFLLFMSKTPGRYGVKGLLLSFVAGNNQKWPPISPTEFIRQCKAKGHLSDLITRFAYVVMSKEPKNAQK